MLRIVKVGPMAVMEESFVIQQQNSGEKIMLDKGVHKAASEKERKGSIGSDIVDDVAVGMAITEEKYVGPLGPKE
ncbi:hypothetical protein ACOSQ3_002503 [Xanthoceras sorbifolium]